MMISQMNQSQLLHWIDMVSFAVVEITEYLDTHPDDEEALKYFNHYADLRRTALRAYAQNYTPLTIDTANPDNYWRWASDPWPWEGGDCVMFDLNKLWYDEKYMDTAYKCRRGILYAVFYFMLIECKMLFVTTSRLAEHAVYLPHPRSNSGLHI